MNKPYFLLAHWPHGWTLNSPPGQSGVPITSFQEALPLFEKGSVLDPGITHHLRTSGFPEVVETIVSPAEGDEWRKEIGETLQNSEAQERWWRGTDTGTSSSTIFSVFCAPQWRAAAKERGNGSRPHDSADLGRCLRLLAEFPEWEKDLHKVAEAYPNSEWPKIIPLWGTLKASSPEEQTRILRGH